MSHPFHSSQCGCAHETLDVAQLATLYPSIDHERIRCFNESQPGQGRSIVRPWEQRHLPSPPLQSHSDDAELLLFVPFTSTVTVKALTLITAGDHAPDKLRLFINREDLDLGSVGDMQAVQELNLAEDVEGVIDYPLKANKFHNVSSLALHFPSNVHPDSPDVFTAVQWLHLKGTTTGHRREAVNVVYEAIARPSDHKAADQQHVARSIQ